MKMAGVMLGSDDPKKLGEFYTKVFGEPQMREDEWYGFFLGQAGLMVGRHSEVKGKNDTPGRIIFMVTSEDFKTDADRIKGLGAEVVAEPYQPDKDRDPDTWLATFADPDGNYFQLCTPWKGM